jgi:hypothetical protein
VDATGEEVLMRLAVVVLGMLALTTGCGTAPAAKTDVRAMAEKSAADSSRIAISYGGTTYFVGEWDFQRNIGSFRWGPSENKGWDQIVTSDATYTRVGALPSTRATDKTWMKWEADDSKENAFGGSLFGLVPSDPTQLLTMLKSASSVHARGKGQERGVAVTRYRADLDVDQALQTLPKDERNVARSMLRQYQLGTDGKIPLDLAVDDSGRLRQVAITVPEGEMLSIEFFDYGLEVYAKAPPADEVMSREELSRRISEACPEEKTQKSEREGSDCITIEVGESETGYGGLTSTSMKEGR